MKTQKDLGIKLAGMQLVGETHFFIKTPISAIFEVGK